MRLFLERQCVTGVTQVADLYGKAEPIVGTAALANHRQVGFRESVVPNKFVVGRREREQLGALGIRQQPATWHVSRPFSNIDTVFRG